jgi:hypothetical protein
MVSFSNLMIVISRSLVTIKFIEFNCSIFQ